jgi:hypothetical protein
MITETFFLLVIPYPIHTLSLRDHDVPAGSHPEVAAAHVGDKNVPLSGTEREDGAVGVLTVPNINMSSGRRRDLYTLARSVRPRALSPIISVRALNILVDLATTHHTLLDSDFCLRYLFQR